MARFNVVMSSPRIARRARAMRRAVGCEVNVAEPCALAPLTGASAPPGRIAALPEPD